MNPAKLSPAFPPNLEVWEDGRTWECPPIWCWRCRFFGHKTIHEITDDLRWHWDRCTRCGVRGPKKQTDLRWLEWWGGRLLEDIRGAVKSAGAP